MAPVLRRKEPTMAPATRPRPSYKILTLWAGKKRTKVQVSENKKDARGPAALAAAAFGVLGMCHHYDYYDFVPHPGGGESEGGRRKSGFKIKTSIKA
ncbi:hypothetical protein THAOC_10567 [Thalassiosira oceanica]|uniref:Uncharacterized protein n=1 Tax=Thalassiosira oceanica TaxID=159749 RepID=K0STG9_THAOC|nr:hypothetical protein THAOC_10567 [Thalassiosira oceanica]|eukprot:EJK68269.1 hypothetical protein THAOC_10567 [Thalassiosira oceanica]